MKDSHNFYVSVSEPWLFVAIQLYWNFKLYCFYFFSNSVLPNWGRGLYMDVYGISVYLFFVFQLVVKCPMVLHIKASDERYLYYVCNFLNCILLKSIKPRVFHCRLKNFATMVMKWHVFFRLTCKMVWSPLLVCWDTLKIWWEWSVLTQL